MMHTADTTVIHVVSRTVDLTEFLCKNQTERSLPRVDFDVIHMQVCARVDVVFH